MTRPLSDVLAALNACQRNPQVAGEGRYLARCPSPSHGRGRGDRTPSLSIRECSDGTVLLHCFAGCSPSDILGPIGLEVRDLFPRTPGREVPARARPFRRRLHIRPSPGHEEAKRLVGLANGYRADLRPSRLEELADGLGIPPASLRALDVGWSRRHACWTFPMRDHRGLLVGFRLRSQRGTKTTLSGTRNGLFLPADLRPEVRLHVAEGPTDTAALHGLDLAVVGRPSCHGGREELLRLVPALKPPEVVIVADNDEPGLNGARKLQRELVRFAPVRVIVPPAADARAWIRRGAERGDIEALVEGAAVSRIRVAQAPPTCEGAS